MVGERIPSRGPEVEIVTPSGDVLRPQLLDSTDWQPTVNDRPQFDAVTPYSERKFDRFRSLFDEDLDIEARAWLDGVRLPIDRLEYVAPDRRQGTITLVCTGGRQLERFRSLQIDEAESDDVLRDLVTDETDYATDIDAPVTRVRERIRQFQALNTEDWQEFLADELESDGTFPVDVPLRIQNGDLEVLRTTHFDEAEEGNYQGSLSTQDTRYSDERSVELSSAGDYVEIDADNPYQYDVPAGRLQFSILWAIDAPSDHVVDIDAELTGSEDTVPLNFTIGGDGGQFETDWNLREAINDSGATTGGVDARLTLNAAPYDQDAAQNVSIYADAIKLEDSRYDTGEDDVPDDQGRLKYPRSAPSIAVESVDLATIERVIAGEIEIDANGTSSETGIALSNDGGDTWPIAATDTETVAGDFAEASNQIRARITLGSWEDEDSTPVDSPLLGRNRQSIDIATLFADLEDTPVVLSELYEGPIAETLTTVGNDADYNLELRRDPAADPADRDGMIVAATQAGQRQRDSRARLVDVSGRRTIEDSYDRVIVEGQSSSVEDFERTGLSAGSGITLGEENIVTGSETITSTDGETVFEFGEDYEVDYESGLLTVLEGGDMVNTDFLASFEWKVRDQYPSEFDLQDAGITDPRTLKEQAPSATTERQCGQLALLTYQQVKDPVEEVEITLTAEVPDASLIAALSHPAIPFEDVQITEGDHQAGEIRLSAKSRLSGDAIFDRLKTQLNDVAEQL